MTQNSKPTKQKIMDQKLDESLEDTFPASDPQSTLMPDVSPQDQLLQKNHETKGRVDKVEKHGREDFIDKTDV